MANIFGGMTDEETDNLLRLYNPQAYYLQNPYIPPAATQPVLPTPQPVELPGGNGMGPNQDIESNPFNPNIIGQYFGYQNPNYPGAPQIDPVSGLPSSAIMQDEEYGYTPIGTNIDDDEESPFGLASLLQFSPTLQVLQAIPQFVSSLFSSNNPNDPEGDGTQDPGPGIGGFTDQDDAREQYGVNAEGTTGGTTGGASKEKQKENQALGAERGFNFGGR